MREWKAKREVMHHYDQMSQVYDTQYAAEQEEKIKAALDHVTLGKNGLMVDMGCGTGLLFKHVASSANLVAGIDISSRLLKKAKNRGRQNSNVAIIRADADYAPFQNQTFDWVFAVTLLQNMPTPIKTLQEMKRVSSPESGIIVTGLKKKFTQEDFVDLLKKAELRVSNLVTSNRLKGYVAVCQKRRENP